MNELTPTKAITVREKPKGKANKNLLLLLEISKLIVTAQGLPNLLESALDILLKGLRYFAGRIYLMDPGGKTLSLAAWEGISKDRLEKVGTNNSFTGLAALNKAIVAHSVEELSDETRKAILKERGIASVVCIPIFFGKDVVGVLNLASNRPAKLREAYVEVLSAIANQLGVAITCFKTIDQLKEKTNQLQKEQEAIRFFTYCITHDLKNPAAAIVALIKRLLEKSINPKKLTLYFNQIHSASLQIYHLIQDLNSYIATKELPLSVEELDIITILEDIKSRYEKDIKDRNITFTIHSGFRTLKGDGVHIKRAILNLVDNSFKYGGENLRHIDIILEETQEFKTIRVKDDGVGLKEEEIATLFDPFQRKSSAKGTEGSGLGLAIVRTIMERHQGTISVNRPKDGGIEFCLSFPKDGPSITCK